MALFKHLWKSFENNEKLRQTIYSFACEEYVQKGNEYKESFKVTTHGKEKAGHGLGEAYDGLDRLLNKFPDTKTYLYDINNVGEYDGYIGYKRDDRIGSDYNYAVKVTDENLSDNKYSYDVFNYSYIGSGKDKTILLAKLTDEGSNHKNVTDYCYDEAIKLPLSVIQKSYTAPDAAVYMATSKAYTYDDGKFGDILTEIPNGSTDRKITYTYDTNFISPQAEYISNRQTRK